MNIQLDSYDRKLLALVQKNCRMSAEQQAQIVGLSKPAVHRRLKRLRDAGFIAAEVAVLDSKKLDKPMTFIVNLEVERERLDLLDQLKKELAEISNVQQCYYVTGDYDFMLIVKTADMDEFEKFTHQTFFGNTNVRRFKTSVVLSEVKTTLEVPID
jgi:Lrp/AsnC family leucine-responsive transcriptional regulator